MRNSSAAVRLGRHVAAMGLALLLAAGPVLAQDREQATRDPSATEMLADAAVARPVGLIGTVIGGLAFVVTLPFTWPSGSVSKAAHNFVVAPFNYTFKRPLGQFDDCDTLPDSCR